MNKLIIIFISILYFGGYQIALYFEPTDIVMFNRLRVLIYMVIIVMAFTYKSNGKSCLLGIYESVLVSIIFYNGFCFYFFAEKGYSLFDLIIIPLTITLEYAKYHKNTFRKYLHRNI